MSIYSHTLNSKNSWVTRFIPWDRIMNRHLTNHTCVIVLLRSWNFQEGCPSIRANCYVWCAQLCQRWPINSPVNHACSNIAVEGSSRSQCGIDWCWNANKCCNIETSVTQLKLHDSNCLTDSSAFLCIVRIARVWLVCHKLALFRPSNHPGFDHLQYAKTGHPVGRPENEGINGHVWHRAFELVVR